MMGPMIEALNPCRICGWSKQFCRCEHNRLRITCTCNSDSKDIADHDPVVCAVAKVVEIVTRRKGAVT